MMLNRAKTLKLKLTLCDNSDGRATRRHEPPQRKLDGLLMWLLILEYEETMNLKLVI